MIAVRGNRLIRNALIGRNISHTKQQISTILLSITLDANCPYAFIWCVEIYIEINNYWLAIKFIPFFPELFSLVHLSFLILNDCFSAQRGNLLNPSNFLPVDLHQLLSMLKISPAMQIRCHMSDSIQNLYISSNLLEKKSIEKGNVPSTLCWWQEPWHTIRG